MRALLALLWLVAVPASQAEIVLWVDAQGHTHATNDPDSVPRGAIAEDRVAGELAHLWEGRWTGPPVRMRSAGGRHGDSSSDEARIRRLLRGAVADLERGEAARAAAALQSVLRVAPKSAEAHWYLALLDRQRGRFDSAERHLEAFLAHAGDSLDDWRASARRRLATLRDERRLATETGGDGFRLRALRSAHFRIHYDANLATAEPSYPDTVVRYLEDAYQHAEARLGTVPLEATGVVLYGKAAYQKAYANRFSFPTVGFYDGRIHVVSAAHPAGELRGLLFHEFTHALFRERTGGHRPFWLNEGFAELAERASARREALTRSERSLLRRHIDAGSWIPLRQLAPGFGGLSPEQARLAYLEATAAAAWIERRSDATSRRLLLDRLGAGETPDAVLKALVGRDTDGIDRAIRQAVNAHFP